MRGRRPEDGWATNVQGQGRAKALRGGMPGVSNKSAKAGQRKPGEWMLALTRAACGG